MTMARSPAVRDFHHPFPLVSTPGLHAGPTRYKRKTDFVHFHFDVEDLDQHGVVSADRNSMGGTSTWVATDGAVVTMTGNWTAHR